jgi:hypothetical protein
MSETIHCPACKGLVDLDVNVPELRPDDWSDLEVDCPTCKAELSVSVCMTIYVGRPLVVSDTKSARWRAVRQYYDGRTLEDRLERWSVSAKPFPLSCVLREIHGRTQVDGKTYVADGYVAVRSDDASPLSPDDDVLPLGDLFANLLKAQEHPAAFIARIIGAGDSGFGAEDYAAMRDETGRTVYIKAHYADAALQERPDLRVSTSFDGNLVVLREGADIFMLVAPIQVDPSRDEQVALVGGEA